MREEIIGDARLILGDCREIAPSLSADSVISDPPYGIDFDFGKQSRASRSAGLSWGAGHVSKQPEWSKIIGDDRAFDPTIWLGFREVILWGANNYPAMPAARCWLVWDKRRASTPDHYGDCELAWTNLDSVIRCHRQVWRGIVREGEENVANTAKSHPAQKPAALMAWCVAMTKGAAVLDPFMGSGTTGVAALRLGRKFTGIEIEERWFDVACRRIEAEAKQGRLLIDETPQARPSEQGALL